MHGAEGHFSMWRNYLLILAQLLAPKSSLGSSEFGQYEIKIVGGNEW